MLASGAKNDVATWHATGEWTISDMTDIHAVCDLIKSWFRVLPGGLFPPESYKAMLAAAGTYRTLP